MKQEIKPQRLQGKVNIPCSKSVLHRLLLGAALSVGESFICGKSLSDDVNATIACIEALGASVQEEEEGYRIWGIGEKLQTGMLCNNDSADYEDDEYIDNERGIFMCNESGSTLRFLIPIASVVLGGGMFYGTPKLMSRPLGIYEDIFGEQGINFDRAEGSISVSGQLSASDFAVRGDVSSQFITGLLFALPLLPEDSRIEITTTLQSGGYIDLTLQLLAKFGIVIYREENALIIPGEQVYVGGEFAAEADESSAAVFWAMNALGSDIEVCGLSEDSLQPDRVCREYLTKMQTDTEAVLSLMDCPDLGPVLMAAATQLNGARFTNTKRLRYKESDRLGALAEELVKFGLSMEIMEDEVIIAGNQEGHAPTEELCGHNDHRIVMALALLCTRYGGCIDGAQAVAKSFPEFWDNFLRLTNPAY